MILDIPYEQRVLGNILADRASRYAEQPFLTVGGRCYTFTEAYEISQAFARGLKRLGVAPGEPVLLMLNNSAEFVFSWFALMLLNATCVPVNTAYVGEMLAYVVGDVKARIVITSVDLAPAISGLSAEQRGELTTMIVSNGCAGPSALDILAWEDLMITSGAPVQASAHPGDRAFICYTSGSTGPSKGVIVPHSQVLQTVQTFINAVGMTPEDTIFSPLPLFHGMSRSMAVLPALFLGAQVHLAARFSASSFWADVRNADATISTTIFTIPPILKSRPHTDDDRNHKVRVMFNAHHDLEFEERFGVRLVEAYGMTEVSLPISTVYPQRVLGASGKPGDEWEAMLVDDRGLAVPAGSVGELLLRPRKPGLMMDGYFNKPEATLSAFRGLWFHTGDLMRVGEDGYYFYAGRMKERIRRRGENISAHEVEIIAARHPEIVECAVLGVPAGDFEDDVYLIAVLRNEDAISAAQLHTWLASKLPKFMVPRYIEFRSHLPKTGSAKIERHALLADTSIIDAWDSLQPFQQPRGCPESGT